LYIDLTSEKVEKRTIDEEIYTKLLGGTGVGFKLATEYLKPDVDPLSPENVVIISVGALVGTNAPGASKIGAITKFPILASEDGKQFIGESTGGGRSFGPSLKRAGYDHLVITGKAKKPIYLRIIDDSVEFVDASDLWGRGADETTDILVKREGKPCGVIAIGKAGENKVYYSMCHIDKTNSLGRSGLGAVFGSKNLKAIVVWGTNPVKVKEPDKFMEVVEELRRRIVEWEGREHWILLGMGAGWNTFKYTQYPGKWPLEKWERLYGEERRLETLEKTVGCHSCLISCRIKWRIKDGEYAGEIGFGSPYGKSATSGQLLDVEDHRKMIHWVTLANSYGIDFYTTTRMIDFVTTLYQQGKLTKEQTGGLELKRDYKFYLELFEKIVNREGFGNIMADGWMRLKQKFGIDPQDYWYGGICKGVDFIYDARPSRFHPLMMTFFTRPRPHHGGSHTLTNRRGQTIEAIRKQVERWGLPKETVDRIFTPSPVYGKFHVGLYTKYMEDMMKAKNALGLCSVYTFFGLLFGDDMARLYSAATGIHVEAYDLVKAGERIFNITKLLNIPIGFDRKDDRCPELWFRPMISPEGKIEMTDYFGTKVITREDVEKMLDDYYKERGWDVKRGLPTKQKLSELELDKLGIPVDKFLKA